MNDDGWGIMACIVSLLMIGGCCGNLEATNRFQSQAIERGVAYYHPETKEFTWKAVEDDK